MIRIDTTGTKIYSDGYHIADITKYPKGSMKLFFLLSVTPEELREISEKLKEIYNVG